MFSTNVDARGFPKLKATPTMICTDLVLKEDPKMLNTLKTQCIEDMLHIHGVPSFG